MDRGTVSNSPGAARDHAGSISVIIPTLNEEDEVVSLLDHLDDIEDGLEVIVVDGGSRDSTTRLAGGRAKLVHSPRGRAIQMNAGARAASGEILWFLHADCRPHRDSLAALRAALEKSDVAGGAFVYILDAPGALLRVAETLSNLKNRIMKLVFGDMGIFVKAERFRAIGGFAEIPLMEDMDLCRRIKKTGRLAILPQPMRTSARRWKREGAWRNIVRTWSLQFAWSLGVPPRLLARYYSFGPQRPLITQPEPHREDSMDPQLVPCDFDATLEASGLYPLQAEKLDVLQINFGRYCNQACHHCHVEAGPKRSEAIDRGTLESRLHVLRSTSIPNVDLTGGTPEANPHFRWFVAECRRLDRHVMVRSNLTILLEPGMEGIGEFFRDQRVEVIASLPCYLEKDVDDQRGHGVFHRSITALRTLNAIGFGQAGTDLILNLVFNPEGPALPPAQGPLEAEFKRELVARHGIVFNRLFTITNMPIGRFRDSLRRTGDYDEYMSKLAASYNPAAAVVVMCKRTLSVGWNGLIYDCDFNQMLEMTCDHGAPRHIRDFDLARLETRRIVTGQHCFGCTAGSGSSCTGALIDPSTGAGS